MPFQLLMLAEHGPSSQFMIISGRSVMRIVQMVAEVASLMSLALFGVLLSSWDQSHLGYVLVWRRGEGISNTLRWVLTGYNSWTVRSLLRMEETTQCVLEIQG